MAQTKMIVRTVSDQRWTQFQRRQQAAACGWVRSEVKNIEERERNKTFKIKQLIAVPENVQVKKNGEVVWRMTVCRRAMFPPDCQHAEY